MKELFETTLLPDNYVACSFESHNFSVLEPLIVTAPEKALTQLVLWYFSDQLKVYYQRMVKQLAYVSIKTIEMNI